jgi:starvation-inducible DNA-binding protein
MKTNSLMAGLKRIYADNFLLYYKSHAFHFNVQGPMFAQDHSLLEEVYNFLWEQHDVLGEQIRQMDATVAPSLAEILSTATATEYTKADQASKTMFNVLITDIDELMADTQTVYKTADEYNCGGLETMLGDYLKGLSKLQWKLKATNGVSIK